MAIELTPFKAAHLTELQRGLRDSGLPMDFIAQVYEERGIAFSAYDAGQILGSAGLVLECAGMAHAWVMLWPLLERRQALFIGRTLRQWLREMATLYHLRRVQTYGNAAQPRHLRLLDWLGFEAEGLLRHYGPRDETYIAFAWFPGEAEGGTDGGRHSHHCRGRDGHRRRRHGLQPSAAGANGQQGGEV